MASRRRTPRTVDVLRWYVSPRHGLPAQPFTVWRWRREELLSEISYDTPQVATIATPTGIQLVWDGDPAAVVWIAGTWTGPLVAYGYRVIERPDSTCKRVERVVTTAHAASAATTTELYIVGTEVRFVELVGENIATTEIAIGTVDELINHVRWSQNDYEIVGYPYAWPGLYEHRQGLQPNGASDQLQAPVDAARSRLVRATPELGWPKRLPDNRPAPPWQHPDPDQFIDKSLNIVNGDDALPRLLALDPAAQRDVRIPVRRSALTSTRTPSSTMSPCSTSSSPGSHPTRTSPSQPASAPRTTTPALASRSTTFSPTPTPATNSPSTFPA